MGRILNTPNDSSPTYSSAQRHLSAYKLNESDTNA